MVVKFLNKEDCEVLFVFNKDKANDYAKAYLFGNKIEVGMLIQFEDINESKWKDVLYDEERGFWDGQPVWCWDKDYETIKSLGFYDAKHNRLFDITGSRCGNMYDNYEPYPHLTDEWVIEAYNKLKF